MVSYEETTPAPSLKPLDAVSLCRLDLFLCPTLEKILNHKSTWKQASNFYEFIAEPMT